MRRVLGRRFHNHHDESKDERSVRGDSSARGNQEQICEIIVVRREDLQCEEQGTS